MNELLSGKRSFPNSIERSGGLLLSRRKEAPWTRRSQVSQHPPWGKLLLGERCHAFSKDTSDPDPHQSCFRPGFSKEITLVAVQTGQGRVLPLAGWAIPIRHH